MSVKSIKLDSLAKRAALLALCAFCLICFFFSAKWFFANAVAPKAAFKEIAEIAIALAPDDPQTHYALAALSEKTFLDEDLPKSLSEYERAAALSPDDFRLWFALGKARDRVGDQRGAELALRKTLELAPNYAQVQWTYGNVLLREGKTQEAFAQMRRAAEGDQKFAAPLITTAWLIFDENLAAMRQAIGGSPAVNAALATYLAKQKRFDEALYVWNGLPLEQRKTSFNQNGKDLVREMLAAKRFRDALQIEIETGEAAGFAPGKIFNPGFEADVKTKEASVFEWQISDALQPQIGFDDREKHAGNRSLVIVFNSATGKDFRSVSQTVAVEPDKIYVFEAFYKSDLRTSATFRWEIFDLSNERVLAATDAIAAISDWTNLSAEFKAPENAQAVAIRLVPENCKTGLCPITGKVWFDDFSVNQK